MGDTAVVPYDQQTSASRATALMGMAVLAACRDIQAQLRTLAARVHGADEARHRRRTPVSSACPDGRELDPSRCSSRVSGRSAES